MPYSHQYSFDFGIIAYEISESVKSDFTILISPCMQYNSEYFKDIEENLRCRLGVDINVHSLSTYSLDSNEPFIGKSFAFLTLDDLYVQKTIEQINYENLLNLNSKDGITKAVNKLIFALSDSSSSLIV